MKKFLMIMVILVIVILIFVGCDNKADPLINKTTNISGEETTSTNKRELSTFPEAFTTNFGSKETYQVTAGFGDVFDVESQAKYTEFGTWYIYKLWYEGVFLFEGVYEKETIEIYLYYIDEKVTAYSLMDTIIYKYNDKDEFYYTDDYDKERNYRDEQKPFLRFLLKKGRIHDAVALFLKNDPEALKVVKEYANGDFSSIENHELSGDELNVLKIDAKNIIKEYGLD